VTIVDSTRSYENWLEGQIEIVRPDLECKWALMAEDAFVCFRGTYYRWLETIGDIAPELDGPAVGVVGDLHVENFGTWRDAEGRHVWGVNDFDESEELPYTYDLARLATSATLAIGEAKKIKLAPEDAATAILDGYRRGLDRGGRPFVLAARNRRLARMVGRALDDPKAWWVDAIDVAPADGVPPRARVALKPVLPARAWTYEVGTRGAGVGSRGHRRVVLIGDCGGAPVARELKELAPPASQWLGRPSSAGAETRPGIVRSRDPMRAVRGGWVARRLAPDCVKLKLGTIRPSADARRLLTWMGAETANIHLGSEDRIADVRADLESREPGWLHDAARRLATAARRDHKDWKRHYKRL
jgi:hypothetical protein